MKKINVISPDAARWLVERVPHQWRAGARVSSVVAPFVFSVLLVSLLSYVLYSGTRRDRLSLRIEGVLIRETLRRSQAVPKQHDRIVVVSGGDQDRRELGASPSQAMRGIDIRRHAEVLQRVAEGRPKHVVMTWVSGAHEATLAYLRPIVDVVQGIGHRTRVDLAYPIDEIRFLPAELRRAVRVFEGDSCGFHVQSYCTYNREWPLWIVQAIADRYWTDPDRWIQRHHVSGNLPHHRPMFLVNVASPSALSELRFADVLRPEFDASIFAGKTVFIGESVTQDPAKGGDSDSLSRALIPSSDLSKDITESGVPYHVFWALLAQMFIDQSTVAVPPAWVTWAMTLFLSTAIVVMLWRVGAVAALTVFIVYALLYPFANIWGVRVFATYIPMFDAIYVGLLTFLFAATLRLSYQTYRRHQAEARSVMYRELADMRKNFIAMVSHNLNTPVARMQGLMDVLRLRAAGEADHEPTTLLQKASWYVSYLQLGVRSILVTMAMEERAIRLEATTWRSLGDEFGRQMSGLLGHLGATVCFEPYEGEAGLDLFVRVPVRLDVRGTLHALAALVAMALRAEERHEARLRVLAVKEQGDHTNAILEIELGTRLSDEAAAILTSDLEGDTGRSSEDLVVASDTDGGRHAGHRHFFLRAFARLVQAYCRSFAATQELVRARDGRGDRMRLVLPIKELEKFIHSGEGR